MHISDFDYELPPELIAREPARPRDASRMMVLDRAAGSTTDSEFRKLPEFLSPSDVLVINDTRVIRARVSGRLERAKGGSRDIDVFFAGPIGENAWEVLCRPGKKIRPGDRVVFERGVKHDGFKGIFGDTREHGLRVLHMQNGVDQFLAAHGRIPIPPYLEREDAPSDAADYQTVFAQSSGAVAAPTAGLHFTAETLDAIRAKGIEIITITLHVGIGTFLPVRTDDPAEHVLKPERFHMTAKAASRLNLARSENRRIVAVGTTTTRTLEYVATHDGSFSDMSGEADIFILPGYEFKAVGAMLTNFHLPKSTLIMLVSAFSSRDRILASYKRAVEQRYRFYSYGDCMLIL